LVKSIVEDDETEKRDIILSRSDSGYISRLMDREVPEISSGAVVIEKIARSPGIRSKVAVSSKQAGVDPVGSCIGQKGSRIQSVLNEVPENEKIDIVLYSEDIKRFLIESLSPASDVQVISIENGRAEVTVPEDQLALAIGSGGENIRLAGVLVELDINVTSAPDTKKA
jgi:N utilization substance protein A